MKKSFVACALVLLCACSEQYNASNNVQSHVQDILSKQEVNIAEIEVSVRHNDAEIIVENTKGISIKEIFSLPRPNVYQGTYTINYSCDNSDCNITYDERSAEDLNDALILSLFDKYVVDVIEKLAQKQLMLSN